MAVATLNAYIIGVLSKFGDDGDEKFVHYFVVCASQFSISVLTSVKLYFTGWLMIFGASRM